jgi:hypothetical protein
LIAGTVLELGGQVKILLHYSTVSLGVVFIIILLSSHISFLFVAKVVLAVTSGWEVSEGPHVMPISGFIT